VADALVHPWHPFKSEEAQARYLALYDEQARAWPLASEQALVSTEDGDTFVRISGPADGPPLVLLPASRASSICWISMIEMLSERFRTYAVDAIYDVGRSVNRRPIKTVDDAIRWLDNLFDELGLSSGVNLMGLSLGACTAAEYVLHAPRRLAKAVWLAPAGVVAPISAGFILRSLPCMVSPRAFEPFMRWIMSDVASSSGDARAHYDRAVEDVVLSTQCYKMRPMPGGAPREFRDDEFATIDTPVLYVVGENERVCSNAHKALSRLNAVAPQIRTELVDGCGHDIFWMRPDDVSRHVLNFLDAGLATT